jgi:hypothetical protein
LLSSDNGGGELKFAEGVLGFAGGRFGFGLAGGVVTALLAPLLDCGLFALARSAAGKGAGVSLAVASGAGGGATGSIGDANAGRFVNEIVAKKQVATVKVLRALPFKDVIEWGTVMTHLKPLPPQATQTAVGKPRSFHRDIENFIAKDFNEAGLHGGRPS